MLVDVATGYGSTSSWPRGRGPGLGEREGDVQDVGVPRFERLTVQLLSAGRGAAR